MSNVVEKKIYPLIDNLWSFHNHRKIDTVMLRLKELKMQGQYYDEINMPEVEKIIKGLRNDVEILKNDKLFLVQENKKLKDSLEDTKK